MRLNEIIDNWTSKEYGHCIGNPILLNGIGSEFDFLTYLVRKPYMSFVFHRLGSTSHLGSKPIDVYEIKTKDGKYKDLLFLYPYSDNNDAFVKVPDNYRVISREEKVGTLTLSFGITSFDSDFPLGVLKLQQKELGKPRNRYDEKKLRKRLTTKILLQLKGLITLEDIIEDVNNAGVQKKIEKEIILFREDESFDIVLIKKSFESILDALNEIPNVQEYNEIQNIYRILNPLCFQSKGIVLNTAFEMIIAIRILLYIWEFGGNNKEHLVNSIYLSLPKYFHMTFDSDILGFDRAYFPIKLNMNLETLLEFLIENPSITSDFDDADRVSFNQRSFLPNLSKEFIFDEDFFKSLLSHDPMALKYASDSIKDAKNIVRIAIENHENLIEEFRYLENGGEVVIKMTPMEFASDRLKDDYDFVLEMIKFNANNLRFASLRLRNNINIGLSVMEQKYFTADTFLYSDLSFLKDETITQKYKKLYNEDIPTFGKDGPSIDISL